MKKIYLGGKYGSVIGNYALVDDDVYEEVNKYNWYAQSHHGNYYAKAVINNKEILMHRFIWKLVYGDIPNILDHINHNGLDNRLINLRQATKEESARNRRKTVKKCSSKYVGVTWNKSRSMWCFQFNEGQGNKIIGHWKNEIDAAYAHDYYALKYHGEFAYLNFPKQTENFYLDVLSRKYKRKVSSEFSGVSWHKRDKIWQSSFKNADGKWIYIGRFNTEKEAIMGRDKKILQCFGRDANLSFPWKLEYYLEELNKL